MALNKFFLPNRAAQRAQAARGQRHPSTTTQSHLSPPIIQAKQAPHYSMPVNSAMQQRAIHQHRKSATAIPATGRPPIQAKMAPQPSLPNNNVMQQRAQVVNRSRNFSTPAQAQPGRKPVQAKMTPSTPPLANRFAQRAQAATVNPSMATGRPTIQAKMSPQPSMPFNPFLQQSEKALSGNRTSMVPNPYCQPRQLVVQFSTKMDIETVKPTPPETKKPASSGRPVRKATKAIRRIHADRKKAAEDRPPRPTGPFHISRSVAPKNVLTDADLMGKKPGTSTEQGYQVITHGGKKYTRANIPDVNYYKEGTPKDLHLVSDVSRPKGWKKGLVRVHVKGTRDDEGKVSGITPHYISGIKRDDWPEYLRSATQKLGRELKDDGVSSVGGLSHHAEASHALGHANLGSEEEINAFAASGHQNTEQLAIENAFRDHVAGKDDEHGKRRDNLRLNITGYVHGEENENPGRLKYQRFKIYRKDEKSGKWHKVVDHLMDGQRGDIDKTEAKHLYESIQSQIKSGPALGKEGKLISGGALKPKGIGKEPSPPKPELMQSQSKKRRKSGHHETTAAFTDVKLQKGKKLTGLPAKQHIHELLTGGQQHDESKRAKKQRTGSSSKKAKPPQRTVTPRRKITLRSRSKNRSSK